jgi:uncharacterized repeat protein (TIGR01451 family)
VVSEAAVAGYTGTFSGDCDATGSVTLALGDAKTCTLTNDDLAPSLAVQKAADSAVVSAGNPIGFTITVTNQGGFSAKDVSLADALPVGAGLDWSIDSQPAAGPCAISGTAPAPQTLTCAFGTLPANGSVGVHVTSPTATDSAGTYRNTAAARSGSNPPATSNAASVAVRAFKVIVLTCATTDNTNYSLVPGRATLNGTSLTTLASGDSSALCNLGGAAFAPLAGTGTAAQPGPYTLGLDVPSPIP